MSKLIGKKATITDIGHPEYFGWGIIDYYDGEYYHIAMFGDHSFCLVFKRGQFKVKRG